MNESISRHRALSRIEEFEFDVQRRIQRRLGIVRSSPQEKLILNLACHAALPVLLNAEIVHLIRINFFNGVFKKGEELTSTAERDFLFSDICVEIGGGLYKIDQDVRKVLLERLLSEYGIDRAQKVAALLWKYTANKTSWGENARLDNAQRLTALNFLDPGQARTWRNNARDRIGKMSSEEDWALAMITELEKLDTFNIPSEKTVKYATAKIVLLGDSGVGKTGLGWRLAHGEFKEHASTHGQQFWTIPQLNFKRKDGTDCEAVLWDLAGQHIYRQVHSIFLENVTAAIVLFDPTNRQDPLKGVQFWLEQLKDKGQLPPTVLVGARVDRGAPALSQDELNQFCQRYGIKGGYISTSALKGDGLDELMEILKKQIPWDEMTATITTVTFKRIKDYVLSLKEKTDRKGVLVNPADLRKQLEATDKDWNFTNAEMMTAVGHLETHGYVSVLQHSAGEQYILLTPDLLVNLAASIMLLADKNARELGAVSETELLGGKIPLDELKGLEEREQQILIDAAILRFLEHNICFRETFNEDTLLIFPSLIKQKRPLQDDIPSTDDISYVVRGRVESLYASLVVLLGYTPTFSRINQWQNQAQYVMKEGELCGFRLIEEHEGEIELVLYYADKMPQSGRDKFQELFEQFLYQHEVEVTRFSPVICKNGHRQERTIVIERVRNNKPFMFCDECGEKITLPEFDKPQIINPSPWLQREEAMARLHSSYTRHLTNIKSYRRGWSPPRAYLSYLPEQKQWTEKLTNDLRDAGVFIIEKPEGVKDEDFIIIFDTPAFQKAYQSSSPTLTNDITVIKARLSGNNKKLLSLTRERKVEGHDIKSCQPGDFSDDTHYPVSLLNLVMELYAIPLNHKGFEPLRLSLHEQWEQTLAG
ncbi:MAG TPA: hypothetical protein DCX54_00280, partial [Flavobacteriales bacterium]|nr:hypothetical protein [Flavobacteriales bacterium]